MAQRSSSRRKPAANDDRISHTKSERREARRQARGVIERFPALSEFDPIALSGKRLLPTAAKTARQVELLECLQVYRIIAATGPAGGGKTFLPVADALDRLAARKLERLIFLRPAIEAGAPLGFLPGDLGDKIDPFFWPIKQAIEKKLGVSFGKRWLKAALQNETVLFLSTQHLRGSTLENAYIHTDEAQNCTYNELKMIITRMGTNSQFVFSGDPGQNDLNTGYNRAKTESGWPEFVARLAQVPHLAGIVRFVNEDSVRDPVQRDLLNIL